MKHATWGVLLMGLVCVLLMAGARAGDDEDVPPATQEVGHGRYEVYTAKLAAAGQPGRAMVPHPTTPELGDGVCDALALGDLDLDGDLDAVVAGRTTVPTSVWLNDGTGAFFPQPVTPTLGLSSTHDVALGDLDGDGDLDALVADFYGGAQVWLNVPASRIYLPLVGRMG